MNKQKVVINILLLIVTVLHADVPFQRGFNFSIWFEQNSAQQIQFTYFTREDFVNVRNLGCDHVRLPVHFFNMCGPEPDYTIDPLLFKFLDHVVDWVEDLDMYLIIDNHSFDVNVNTSAGILNQLVKVWQQVADRYKERSHLLFYEILNEPHGIADSTWNRMQRTVIDSIRAIDENHTIIIGPAGWNSYDHLKYMPEYNDPNLIYTFHFYEPFLFTHQGATWVTPPMDIKGVPFPFDELKMPDLPDKLKGTWIEWAYNDYPEQGTEDWVKSQIDIAVDFSNQRNVPVWCGEFGAYIPNSTTEDRARWLELVRKYFEENNIAWTMWGYKEGFGIFEPGSSYQFDYDVNVPIIEALGIIVPEQREYILLPDTTGFVMYDDYIEKNIYSASWISSGTLNYYCEQDPAQGDFCIKWIGADQYNFIGFTFAPVKDFSYLVDNGYVLDLQIKSNYKPLKFDVRFLDTKTDDPADHPWRMRFTIDSTVCSWDGRWHNLRIPLSSFREHGSWDTDMWYEPEGLFDWTRIRSFEIVAEHNKLEGAELMVDDIKISAPSTGIRNKKTSPESFVLYGNYPNPFNSQTKIMFKTAVKSDVLLKIFNLQGQEIVRTLKKNINPGLNSINWDGTDFSGNQAASGVYVYKIVSRGRIYSGRMVLLR